LRALKRRRDRYGNIAVTMDRSEIDVNMTVDDVATEQVGTYIPDVPRKSYVRAFVILANNDVFNNKRLVISVAVLIR
jgi:hypothetical protein